MFEPDLHRLRKSIREQDYELRLHALDELENDGLTILDVEACVRTGSIVERQRDRETEEWKYLIEGWAPDGLSLTVVAKWNAVARMVIVTVFRT